MAFANAEGPCDSLVALLQLAQVAVDTDDAPKQDDPAVELPVVEKDADWKSMADKLPHPPIGDCPILESPDGTGRGKKVSEYRSMSS